MKKALFFFFIITIAGTVNSFAQFTRYIVQLKNKAGTPYSINNPSQFLSQRSINRRVRTGIPIDSTDLPITPAYIDSIKAVPNVTILNVSKWFNQVCIKITNPAALVKINSFSFVKATPPIGARPAINNRPAAKWPITKTSSSSNTIAARPAGAQNFYNYGLAYPQINLHQGQFLHNHGFKGNGMIMAITDEGFINYNTLPTFDSVRINNQLLGTWNYVADDTNISEGIGHGLNCFSTIAANIPGSFVGVAPQTSFYLYVTEDVNSENPIEEQNWAAAAEKADSLGVDVISVSLGYNTFDNSSFDYTYNDLNGHTTLIARAANFAANKGMIVVAAAGNSGEESWHYIDTPGDTDSALSVAAVDVGGNVGTFSGYGPNSSGQTKTLCGSCGVSTLIAYPFAPAAPYYADGTSFACPIMAGLTTCLWQAFPEVSNMDIIDILHKASTHADNPDNRIGYGIPDMKKAFVLLIKKLHTQQSSITNCVATIHWSAKSAADMNFIIERKTALDVGYHAVDTLFANTDFQQNNFTFSDSLSLLPVANNVQYRIKMTIAADTSFYLDSISLDYSASCSSQALLEEKIIISPNPVSDNLTIQVVRNNPVTVSIILYAANGQKVFSLNNQSVSGSNTFTIPMKSMSSGIYYAMVFINNKEAGTKKIVRIDKTAYRKRSLSFRRFVSF